jgi:imidazole glycerol-phosphate synthase subunit HisF
MLTKRIIACLDVRDGKTTKGVRFAENLDIGDPVEMSARYYADGIDELVFYDITASVEGRHAFLDVVERVAARIFIPFCVGGGIGGVDDVRAALRAGADKVSVNTQAVRHPAIISEGARAFGNQCMVLGMDAKRDPAMPSGYRVYIRGGREPTDRDALQWAREAVDLGAGEIVLNSIDADGTKEGYELPLTRLVAESVTVPVIASGGAGKLEHLYAALSAGKADAALVASMLHYGDTTVAGIKSYLADRGILVR